MVKLKHFKMRHLLLFIQILCIRDDYLVTKDEKKLNIFFFKYINYKPIGFFILRRIIFY